MDLVSRIIMTDRVLQKHTFPFCASDSIYNRVNSKMTWLPDKGLVVRLSCGMTYQPLVRSLTPGGPSHPSYELMSSMKLPLYNLFWWCGVVQV